MNLLNIFKSLVLFAFFAIIVSCSEEESFSYYSLTNLPADSGGSHISYPLGTTESPYGYYVYTPTYYGEHEELVYPLLIFLHGAGEKGNSENDPTILNRVLRNGPPDMIEKDEWKPRYPLLVVSPQCHDGGWQADKVKEFVNYLLENYDVNVRRIYLTGLSMGGYGSFSYVGKYGNESLIAATVPICGGGNTRQAESFKEIPLWAFHGEDDNTVLPQKSIDMVDTINAIGPNIRAKLTLFPNIAHNSWDYAYEGTGMGRENPDYDEFNKDIYTWMFQYERFDLDSLRKK